MSLGDAILAQQVLAALEKITRIDTTTQHLGERMATVEEALTAIAADTDTIVASTTALTEDVDRVVEILESRDDLTPEEQALVDSIRTKQTAAKDAVDALNTKLDAAAPPSTPPTPPTF